MLSNFGFNVVACSLDDFYLTREDHQRQAIELSNNPLIQVRGQPDKIKDSSVFLWRSLIRSCQTLTMSI